MERTPRGDLVFRTEALVNENITRRGSFRGRDLLPQPLPPTSLQPPNAPFLSPLKK